MTEYKYNWIIVTVVAAVGVLTLFAGGNMTGYAFVDAGHSKSEARLDFYQERVSNGDRVFVVLTDNEVQDIILYKWKLGTIRETRSAKEEGVLTSNGARFIEPLFDFKDMRGYVFTVRAVFRPGKMSSHYRIRETIAYHQKQLSGLSNEEGTFTHQ